MSHDRREPPRRSGKSSPAEEDARVLAAARRTTRRWTLPLIAAAALTTAALAVLGFLVTGHEQYVPPVTGTDPAVPVEGIAVDTDIFLPEADSVFRESGANLRESSALPPKLELPNMRKQALLDARTSVESSPDISCEESATHELPGGSDRQDGIQLCFDDAVHLHIGAEPGSDATRPTKPDS